MDFLLDPNVAYLILLGAIVLTLLAVVTPGTGVLELGTVFFFVLVGYAAYNLSVNWWAFSILLLSILPFAYAFKSRGKFFLGISILLLVIGSIFLFTRENEFLSVNPFLALFASVVLAVFFWVVGVKFLQTLTTRPKHDLETLIGQMGEARTVIRDEGSVQVDGELWSARSEHEIASGSHIRVVSRDGFTLVVEKVE